MNKYLIFLTLFFISSFVFATHEPIVEFELSGLTCSFCVFGLKKNLEKHTEVEKADISLKHNKARVHLSPGAKVTVEELEAIIKDAGFASRKSRQYGRAEHQCETADC